MRNIIFSIALLIAIIGCKPSNTKKGMPVIASISAGQAHNFILQQIGNESFSLVDVRTPKEFNNGHIESAINIDWLNPSDKLHLLSIPKSNTILVYCRSGKRSLLASNFLKENGYSSILNIQGGILEWNQVIGSYQPDPKHELTRD